MPVSFVGREVIPLKRAVTGFYTFDHAFAKKGEIGFPIKAICEIYGQPGIGKSTTCYWLAGTIATMLETNIAFADTETLDESRLSQLLENAGFNGNVKLSDGDTDGKLVDDLIDTMRDAWYRVGILDSLGGISPISEVESGTESANMGRRAKLAAQLFRKAINLFRRTDSPSILFYTNHMLPNISGMGGRGVVTSGGVVKDFMNGTQIRLKRKEAFDDKSYLLEGLVTKNRFGAEMRKFILMSVNEFGIHHGLTAVQECILMKIVDGKRTIKLDGKSYGYFKSMIENYQDDELFKPFIQAVNQNASKIELGKDDEEEDEE